MNITHMVVGGTIIFVLIVAGAAFFVSDSGANDVSAAELNSFTQCLADEGAMFFGAFWCPNCQDQKILFGKSQKLIPYTECSTLDRKAQLPVCREKNIEAYPTWDFKDGERVVGVLSLDVLASKTGCELPVEE